MEAASPQGIQLLASPPQSPPAPIFRPSSPTHQEIGVDFVAGDGALAFGSGIRGLNMSSHSTPRARSSAPCNATSSTPTRGAPRSRWRGPTDGAVDWGRSDAPPVEEVVGPDGVDFVAGDDALAFGSGVTDLNMVGPLELVVSNGAGEGLAELELLSVSAI
ncbi:hypothetical protein TRIUR3_21400 [Triticum urartu]|uniref:Uncharacterized protein n=1 Tax=Triticum urartu TaxID=4572 RepID=M8A7P0_TRIUA|nr:hypothetical protein TRIUR3_21400 [Triticum urartu]